MVILETLYNNLRNQINQIINFYLHIVFMGWLTHNVVSLNQDMDKLHNRLLSNNRPEHPSTIIIRKMHFRNFDTC